MENSKSNYSLVYNNMIKDKGRIDGIEETLVNKYLTYTNYSEEDIRQIVRSRNILAKRKLSRYFFFTDMFYRKLILHYATLYLYSGLLIPIEGNGKTLNEKHMQDKYFKTVDFIDKAAAPSLMTHMAVEVLINGCYFGLLKKSKKSFTIMDLPSDYCRTRFKDEENNDLVEFNVSYFDTLTNKSYRMKTLEAYPEEVQDYYQLYKTKRVSKWILIPSKLGICFPFLDKMPTFLSVIPAILDYNLSVEIEKEREIEEIKKIIALVVPHHQDKYLLEPIEAEEIHKGVTKMLEKNKNVDVLTSFTGVESLVSRSGSAETSTNNLERMKENIYNQAGASGQIFSSSGNLSLETSIKNDMAFMSLLVKKFENFFTNMLNRNFSNVNISFKYKILDVGIHNQSKYVEETLKMATSGYSFLMPAAAMGISQSDLIGLKNLEMNVLGLDKVLVPLSTSFTQSGTSSEGAGAPEKETKSTKTLQNLQSLDNQGGTN